MSYCQLADLKSYLIGSATSGEDALLQRMLDAATARIDSRTQRTFWAASDSTRTFDADSDSLLLGQLWLDADLSYITSVINGDSANITADIIHSPRNATPWYALEIKQSSTAYWTYTTDVQNAISVTGRWAWMERRNITALSRASNIVTATVTAPDLQVGALVIVADVADTSFNGIFTVTGNTGTTVTWAQTAANDTDTTGLLMYAPTDIVTACRRLAAWMYRQKDTQQGDADRPILAGDGSVIMPTTLPRDVEMLLMPYVRTL